MSLATALLATHCPEIRLKLGRKKEGRELLQRGGLDSLQQHVIGQGVPPTHFLANATKEANSGRPAVFAGHEPSLGSGARQGKLKARQAALGTPRWGGAADEDVGERGAGRARVRSWELRGALPSTDNRLRLETRRDESSKRVRLDRTLLEQLRTNTTLGPRSTVERT